jgi:hydrogenase nickel incorporation protein HypA/HybF
LVHEVGVAQSILDAVAARIVQPSRVREVTVRLGPFSGVDPEALQFAFAVLAGESRCSAASLAVQMSEARGDCARCGSDLPLDAPGPVCPRCGATLTAVRGDDEITLVSVALATEETSHAGA